MWRIRILLAACIALGFFLVGQSSAGGRLFSASITPALPDMSSEKPAPGMFLVARRALGGSYFGQTVIYLVEHNEDGTLGLIVNRPSHFNLSELVPDIDQVQAENHALYHGGPVGMQGILMLVRDESAIEGLSHVADDVYIGAEQRVLDEVLARQKPDSELRFYIGYAGWAAGQLDSEIDRGSWHVIAANTDAIFAGETDILWDRLIERLEPEGIQVRNGDIAAGLVVRTATLLNFGDS